MFVGILTSDKAASLNKVAEDIAKLIKAETNYVVRIFRGYGTEVFDAPEGSKFIVFMPFDPSPALPYFYTAWELKKHFGTVLFYTTIEGKVHKPSVPGWVIRDFDYIACSKYVAERLTEAGIGVKDVIYHGVDIELFTATKNLRTLGRKRLGVSDEDFVIGYIAGCYTRKGHPLFAETLKILAEKDPNIKAFILTSKDCAVFYEDLSNAVPLIDFGRLSNREIAMFYHALDLYVQASLIEGFGLPVLEALAAGKLVVHPDYNPLNEITTPETAIRIPVVKTEFKRELGAIIYELNYYDPNEMAEAILQAKDMVLKDRVEIEARALERAKEFDYRKVYKRFLDYLR